MHSTDYKDTLALKLLSEAGIEDILFDYAMISLLSDTVSGAVHSTDYKDTIALKLLPEAGIENILFDYAMVSLLSDTVSGAQYRLQGHYSSETAL